MTAAKKIVKFKYAHVCVLVYVLALALARRLNQLQMSALHYINGKKFNETVKICALLGAPLIEICGF